MRITRILLINYYGHAFHGFHHLLLAADAVAQPIRNMLTGDTQRRAIFHQPHLVDIRHFRAANTVIDPAYDVAKNALRVVVELGLDFLRRKFFVEQERNGQDVIHTCLGAR